MSEMSALIFMRITEGVSPLEVSREVAKLKGVVSVMMISGEWDLVVKFEYDKMQELSDFVVSNLRGIKGVGKTDTSIILSEVK